MDPELQEMLSLFQDESLDLLDVMEDSLLSMQDSGMDKENINAVFRAVHTVKGGAGMLQLEELVNFTHEAENLLDRIREGEIELTDETITIFLEVKDHLVNLVNAVVNQEGEENYPDELSEKTEELLDIIKQISSETNEIEEEVKDEAEEKHFDGLEFVDDEEDLRVSEDELEKLIAQANSGALPEIVEEDGKNDKKTDSSKNEELVTQSQVEEPDKKDEVKIQDKLDKENDTKETKDIKKSIKKTATLKVDAYKIDALINIVGEIVIANANVTQHARRVGDKELNESVDVLYRMIEELREATMQTRMIPINDTFIRFKRVVRDVAKQVGKNVEMVSIGGETELDKTVIEKISDPLIHLIRNAIDHGIESSKYRKEIGKAPKGTLTLKAFHEAGNIAIQVIDDGRGIDPDIIFQKAVEKGIISKDDKLSKKEIFALIMHPGFSTAEKISNISGRGVGMDVVKKNIEELRGTIDIESEVGVGTTFTIRLPLTLAIIDGFMITITDEPYIIPLEMIIECIELSRDFKNFMQENSYINLRNHVLPLLDLRDFFGYEKIKNTKKHRENIVIVRFGTSKIGLVVDELKGEFQTVIKPLGKVFRNLKGISGATILGDGRVCPILDIPTLINEQIKNSNKRR